jgi:chloride channel 2
MNVDSPDMSVSGELPLAPHTDNLFEQHSTNRRIRLSSMDQSAVFAANVFGRSHNKDLDMKNKNLERNSIVLLLAVGVFAGLVNALILYANSQLSGFQAWIINTHGKNYGIGFLYFLISTCGFVAIAAFTCKTFSLAASGSGLPEFKSLLVKAEVRASDYASLVSVNVLITKIIGLILCVGSCLSVGTEGPLVHVAACIAHLLMRHIHEFEIILDSPSIVKQIFAASAAVGISSAFNAPIGGLLFSVEATTTFYLLSNYWKSCVAAAAGAAVTYLLFLEQEPLRILQMSSASSAVYAKWELLIFLIISIVCAYLASLFLHLRQRIHIALRPFNKKRPIALAAIVALATAFLIYISGSYTEKSVSVVALVSDALNEGKVSDMNRFGVHPIGGALAHLIIRSILSLLGTNITVPCGIFMPVFYLGALFGRFVGGIVALNVKSTIVASYALVGATAFSAGITQTVSVSMIAIEMTGNVNLLLPLLVASVVSAGISRMNGLSIYGMVDA